MGIETQADQIRRCFAQASGAWTGCDWPTEFGKSHFNLQNLSSSQAILMARATAGKEEVAWWEASRWLARIEQQALEAERQARLTVQAAEAKQWVTALAHARQACDIESNYHEHLIWQPLREAVEKALKASSPDMISLASQAT
jgi:hypothetical protein